MGSLVDGVWQHGDVSAGDERGHFVRSQAQLRNWVTADGAAGPSGRAGFKAEPNRYHLYVSLACPWANRTLIMRALKGLEPMIDVSVTHWLMGDQGWTFEPGPGVIADPLYSSRHVHELYTRADPKYTGKVTVPVLWDKLQHCIVSNESAEILRMFNSAFDGLGARPGDYYPTALRQEIDAVNSRVYDTLNNGVYKAGFARSQAAYEAAVVPLFETLDWLEKRLQTSRYVCGDALTEADIRIFTTLARFDSVYHGHFKCNVRRLIDYSALWAYARDLYQRSAFGSSIDFTHIKRHYYMSHTAINPTRVVPVGPDLDWLAPAGRVH
jgi:glutathionyl-hydroquinone reductase